jgi:hypothetical protein
MPLQRPDMKIRDLDYSNHPVNAEHQALGLPPLEREVTGAAASCLP